MSWGIYQERVVFVRFWKPSPVRAGVSSFTPLLSGGWMMKRRSPRPPYASAIWFMFRLGHPRNDEAAEGGLNYISRSRVRHGCGVGREKGERRGTCEAY